MSNNSDDKKSIDPLRNFLSSTSDKMVTTMQYYSARTDDFHEWLIDVHINDGTTLSELWDLFEKYEEKKNKKNSKT